METRSQSPAVVTAPRVETVREDHLDEWLAANGSSALAVVRFERASIASEARPERLPNGASVAPPLEVAANLPQLGSHRLVEVWCGAGEIERGREGDLEFAHDGTSLFGSIELEVGMGGASASATRHAYGAILAFLTRRGYPHPLRMWNVIPDIHGTEAEIERYQQFCAMRSRAFEACYGSGFPRRLCASSAVGSRDSKLLVYFLAARLPGRHWENPRQVSAYEYPLRYGPRSPSFARATSLVTGSCGTSSLTVFVSGTASIVGHESRHEGEAALQLAETLCNLEILVARACGGELRPVGPSALASLSALKVYVRDAADLECLRWGLEERARPSAETLFLEADICRRELLVEVEGVV